MWTDVSRPMNNKPGLLSPLRAPWHLARILPKSCQDELVGREPKSGAGGIQPIAFNEGAFRSLARSQVRKRDLLIWWLSAIPLAIWLFVFSGSPLKVKLLAGDLRAAQLRGS